MILLDIDILKILNNMKSTQVSTWLESSWNLLVAEIISILPGISWN